MPEIDSLPHERKVPEMSWQEVGSRERIRTGGSSDGANNEGKEISGRRDGGRLSKSAKKEKGVILGQYVELTGYVRRYAARLLCQHGKKTRVGSTTIIGDVCKRTARIVNLFMMVR